MPTNDYRSKGARSFVRAFYRTTATLDDGFKKGDTSLAQTLRTCFTLDDGFKKEGALDDGFKRGEGELHPLNLSIQDSSF